MQWNYAFDLGSDTIRMAMRGLDGRYTEPDREACRIGDDAPFARGDEAYEYEGREVGGITLRRFTSRGVPFSAQRCAKLIRSLIALHEKKMPGRRTALVSVSPFMEESARTALLKAMLSEGIDAAGVVDSDFASLLGSGAELTADSACMVLDMGASMISCSCIVNSSRVKAGSLPYGMDRLDSRIYESVIKNESVIPGKQTVREIKHGTYDTGKDKMSVPVFDPAVSLPRLHEIPRELVTVEFESFADEAARLCGEVMTNLPHGCAADILKNGIIITGGGSAILGLDRKLKKQLGVPVKSADDGANCVINGIKTILEQQDRYALLINDWREAGMRA